MGLYSEPLTGYGAKVNPLGLQRRDAVVRRSERRLWDGRGGDLGRFTLVGLGPEHALVGED